MATDKKRIPKRILLNEVAVTAKKLPPKKDKPAKRMFNGNVGVSLEGAKRIAKKYKARELIRSKERMSRKNKSR